MPRSCRARLPVLAAALTLAAASLGPLPAVANDGWGGLSATGLEFGRTDAVAMVSEDLFIGLDRISVDYVFHNITGSDVTGEVIFPLPPIGLAEMMNSQMNLPEAPQPENLVGFTVTVDGRTVTPLIDVIAVIPPPWEENVPPSAQYDTPGRDVTALLKQEGIALTLDAEALSNMLLGLPNAAQARLEAAGLAEFLRDEAGGPAEYVYPAWAIVLRYHWTQTFPAGAEVRVHHSYENRAPGGLFYWEHPARESYLQDYVDRYCIDDSTSAFIARILDVPGQDYNYGTAWNISYVLRTANSWSGPIGDFRLTLDKGATSNAISLCAEGVRKTGPTTFVVEKKNYTPERDLDILIVQPMTD